MAAPATPSVPAVQARDKTIIRITPPFMPNAATWDIYRATTKAGVYAQVYNGLTTLFKDDTGLTANTVYWYKIRASNGDGDSAQSAASSDKTWASWQTASGKVRAAYSAMIDRLKADTDFQTFFDVIDYDVFGGEHGTNYCRVAFGGWTTRPVTVKGQRQHVLMINVDLECKLGDTTKLSETLIQGMEVFSNAYEGTAGEPTFENRVLQTELEFGEIEDPVEKKGEYMVKCEGKITAQLQHYQAGTL